MRTGRSIFRWIIHGMTLVVILLFDRIYLKLAHWLTCYECPKTHNDYERSLLWKIFIFVILNEFIPLGYCAWMKQSWVKTPLNLNFVSELCDGGCLSELAELITVAFLNILYHKTRHKHLNNSILFCIIRIFSSMLNLDSTTGTSVSR